jgi:hypothetical protein
MVRTSSKRTKTSKRTTTTPPQLAQQWGCAPAKVIGFIRRGELRAINLATHRHNRPRYIIDLADIEAFELSRQVVPDGSASTTRRLRRRAVEPVKEFF